MAIHIRATNVVKLKRQSIFRKMLSMALSSAFLFILISAIVLYVLKIYLMDEGDKTFVSYVPPVKEKTSQSKRNSMEESAAASADAMASPPSDILIADTSQFSFDLPTHFEDMSDGMTGLEGLADIGLGAADLGDGNGIGDGDGDGFGDGDGHGAGFNDDIQVVILLDASGSMDSLFQAASACMEDVLTTLSKAKLNGKNTKVNVGIVIYGQGAQNGAPMKLSPFTTAVNKIKSNLSTVACNGGTEECGAAIAYAVHNFEWNRRDRDDMLKVIFIAGNEPFSQGMVDYRSAIREATKENIIVNTIHCGGRNAEWEEAAAMGNGIGLHMDFNYSNTQPATAQDVLKTLQGLHNCKPLPIGSPATQRKYISMLNKANGPNAHDLKLLHKWARDNKERILQGYDWDAIEIYRHSDRANFSLEDLGGIGNLPISLRGQSEEQIIAFLQQEADRRTQLLDLYKSQKSSGNLGDLLLNALQEQASEKGITIDY